MEFTRERLKQNTEGVVRWCARGIKPRSCKATNFCEEQRARFGRENGGRMMMTIPRWYIFENFTMIPSPRHGCLLARGSPAYLMRGLVKILPPSISGKKLRDTALLCPFSVAKSESVVIQ